MPGYPEKKKKQVRKGIRLMPSMEGDSKVPIFFKNNKFKRTLLPACGSVFSVWKAPPVAQKP